MSFLKQRSKAVGALAALTVVVSGCDVTNPGPVPAEALVEPESHEALVMGSGRMLAEGLNSIAYTSALMSKEIYPGGTTGSLGHSVLEQAGYIEPGGDPGQGSFYDDMVKARFVAETALEIFAAAEGVDPDVEALANIYAGYSYRVIAENWCETVFSTSEQFGELESSTARLGDAEQYFTNAIGLATDEDLRLAAHAGRAQVRMWMDDWTGAAADAAEVTGSADPSWTFDINMDEVDPQTRNQLWFANADAPYRAYSMLFTFYGGNDGIIDVNDVGETLPQYPGYSLEVDDPRVPVGTTDTEFASFAVQGFGQVPFLNQFKYTTGNDDIALASYGEMRLIEAEAILQNAGDPADAMAIIDGRRADFGLSNLMTDFPAAGLPAPTTVATAMSYLMRERGIEMWGEGRRWGDLRRWLDTGDGGLGQGLGGDPDLPPFEETSSLFSQFPRSICSDIPDSERDANPNVPSAQAGS